MASRVCVIYTSSFMLFSLSLAMYPGRKYWILILFVSILILERQRVSSLGIAMSCCVVAILPTNIHAVHIHAEISIPGYSATVRCLSTSEHITSTKWIVNSRPLNVSSDSPELTFRDLSLEDNGTTIRCTATFADGRTSTSDRVPLILQGM